MAPAHLSTFLTIKDANESTQVSRSRLNEFIESSFVIRLISATYYSAHFQGIIIELILTTILVSVVLLANETVTNVGARAALVGATLSTAIFAGYKSRSSIPKRGHFFFSEVQPLAAASTQRVPSVRHSLERCGRRVRRSG